ncbi:hypothetical protein ACFYE9_17435 [Rhizobium leguminosarum]|uniref:Uncharacterized protein n=3 Tax=Rhizobium TaxID=379 RepID=A0A154IBZ0_RHILE|nr:hypothetical protein [Rhizobium leguminosarum]KZA97489.1 hypothetical protein A4A59_04880 [Rhizobium leguminosarum]OAP88174.1 hypothetical protein A4U53_08685 [Rhizobium leguminosarum]
MIDPFEQYARPHPGTFDNALAITPDNDNDLSVAPSLIWLGTPGDVRITAMNGETVTLKNPNLLPFLFARAKRIHATGTTASDIVLLW